MLSISWATATEVKGVITSPPQKHSYTTLRTGLVKRLYLLREQRIHQFLTLEMGDRKPSQFLRHLRSLAELRLESECSGKVQKHLYQ
jgi:hypothetical protein